MTQHVGLVRNVDFVIYTRKNRFYCIKAVKDRIIMRNKGFDNIQTESFPPSISTKLPANQSNSRNRIAVIFIKLRKC
ncbi:unnamed protein product [Caenorhabditis angaria]|uniref:Uncharacterized protein n=1 Tax=Caenorhabditis angaria TaxID=860376 RepID=A0A9P1IPE8_9PELO|nr:unnamed protein product [Caenorhabditis angaria]